LRSPSSSSCSVVQQGGAAKWAAGRQRAE
jgi:hypothetical protein